MTGKAVLGPQRQRRSVVKLRLDFNYDQFVAEDRAPGMLRHLAETLNIDVGDISIVDLRSGCVIIVISLPDDAAQELLRLANTEPGRAALAGNIRMISAREGDVIEAAPLSHLHRPNFESHLSWLHISDMHITSDFADTASDTAADLERFLDDLPDCLEGAGIAPDAIFFTGDVAQSGAAEEYEAAETFFVELQERLPYQSRFAPLIIVPGNHDVTWDAIDPKLELKFRRQLSKAPDPDGFCDAAEDYLRERHRNYEDFLIRGKSAIRVPGDGDRFFAHRFPAPVRGVEVGVAAFDSALLSTRKDLVGRAATIGDLDLQFLRLGRRQLRTVAAGLKDCTVRIALMHHEPLSEWYADPDRELQRRELTDYDFVLRGHQHETRARVAPKIAGRDDFMELAPGALHTQPHWFQGFMAVELDLKSRLMRITVWSVTGHSRRWVRDPEFGKDGQTLRALPEKLTRRLPG